MRAEGGDSIKRSWLSWLAVAGLLLLALQAGRAAVVSALGERRPELAAAVWPSHPDPKLALALAEIGKAASEGKTPPSSALALVRDAGRHAPLSAEPLQVAAAARLEVGDGAAGERLLKAALRRDPRSNAAHFMLAGQYIRQERIEEALVHVGVLGRRLRGTGTAAFAGALAMYLRQPGAVSKVAPVLANDPSLRSAVMNSLAADPGATSTLRALVRRGDADETWFRSAFERQLAAGDLESARGLLAAAGVRGGGARLTSWSAEADGGPLSWRLPPGPDGVAEADRNGPLRLVYYGRADAPLADHLLLLPAGRFRLAARFGDLAAPGIFEWRLTCLQGNRPLASVPVSGAEVNQVVEVPPDCPAQRLALWGRMGEFPKTTSASLLQVTLVPVGAAQ